MRDPIARIAVVLLTVGLLGLKSSSAASSSKTHASTKAPAKAVDLNTASEKELETLPGIGTSYARKIYAGRPYKSVSDLSRVGVPSGTIQTITPFVTVSVAAPAAPVATSPVTAAPDAAAPGANNSPTRMPPVKGMVWVNTASKTYHLEGDPWYGRTKDGQFMTESDAIAAGYHAAKKGGAPQHAASK